MENKPKTYKIEHWANLKGYALFLKPYSGYIFLLLCIVSAREVARVIDKFLFTIIIDHGTNLQAGTLSKELFVTMLGSVALAYGAITLAKSLASWSQVNIINKIDGNLMYDLKNKYFPHILGLSHNFHTTHKTGSLIARLGRGAGAMERMTDFIGFNIVPLFIQIILTSISLMYIDTKVGIVIGATVFIFVGYTLLIQKLQDPARAAENEAEDREKGAISDIFTNIEAIKYYGKEQFMIAYYRKLATKSKAALIRNWNWARWNDAGHILIVSLGTLAVIIAPIQQFLAGAITIGTLVFVYTLYAELFLNLYGFSYGIRGFYRSMADFQDIFEYGKVHNDIKDLPNAPPMRVSEGTIEYKDMTFKYGNRTIFTNFSLDIKQNEKVALVGHSGSGKSTLIKLLYRLYDLDKGRILIDGRDIKTVKQESLRSELAIVPQEAVLFDDTIYNNILFSHPTATRKEVLQAIKFAQLDTIIAQFPLKENTIVGQRGVKLSGGEKQRVSIARALLANKRILVLDEATSSLDSQTEHEIQADLKKLLEGRTAIIIAHRLSTIMHADKIVVLDKGTIVQMGTHRQLITKPGRYRQLWNLQKGGYIGE